MTVDEALRALEAGPAEDRLETESGPIETRKPQNFINAAIINKARTEEIKLQGYDFCRSCLMRVGIWKNKAFLSLLEDHHLVPQFLVTHPNFEKTQYNETIRLCCNCHKIAHILIKDSMSCNWEIQFWNEKELIKEIRKFKTKFTKSSMTPYIVDGKKQYFRKG